MAKKILTGLPPDSNEVVEANLTELERKMDRLRTMYESYFMGMEKMAPSTARMEMNRLILEMQQIYIRKAALRFRFRTLMQKWSLHITYWNRTMREIEGGTYRKDLARAQRHLADKGVAITEQDAIAMGIPAQRARAFVAQHNRRLQALGFKADPAQAGLTASAAPRAPASAARAPTAATAFAAGAAPPAAAPPVNPADRAPVPGMSDTQVLELHRRYEEARRTTGERAGGMSLDQLKAMLRKSVPRILQEHMAFGVNFDVGVKDGKVVLRAKPVK